MNNLYDPREKGCTASKGKVFEKEPKNRFGSMDKRGDKGMVNKTTDNLAKSEDDMMIMGMMYYKM